MRTQHSYASKLNMARLSNPNALDRADKTLLARTAFFVLLLTFMLARIVVFLIMSRRIPDLYLYLGGTHVHHLNYGIFLLAGLGAFFLCGKPGGRNLQAAAVVYGEPAHSIRFLAFGPHLEPTD
jgi:hypothetical protein